VAFAAAKGAAGSSVNCSVLLGGLWTQDFIAALAEYAWQSSDHAMGSGNG
jgi:hypothetical protein